MLSTKPAAGHFEGTDGRTLLTLGSADFDKVGGVTKSGTYTMSLLFHFTTFGKDGALQKVSVGTDNFKIDF